MLALNPADRPDASDALDHEYFFEQPLPQPNIIELVDQIKNVCRLCIFMRTLYQLSL